MTPAFELFYDKHLSLVEGGVVDHNLDKGGATWYGISTGFLQGIGRQGPISKDDAKKIAFDYFWEPHGMDQMDPVAAWGYCDALFNHSSKAATRIFQSALDVTVDGIPGPMTRDAAKSINQKLFLERYRIARTRYYKELVEKDPTQLAFLVGWVDRVHRLQQAMLVNGLLTGELAKLPWYQSGTAKATGWGVLVAGLVTTLTSSGADTESIVEWARTQLPQGGLLGVIAAWLAKHRFK